MAKERSLDVQKSIYFTTDMWHCIEQVAAKRRTEERESSPNTVVREAVRYYLDNQQDLIGSRRYFQKTFQNRLDELETNVLGSSQQTTAILVFYFHVLMQMFAFALAHLLTHLTKNSITPQQLIQKSIVEARKEHALLANQVEAVREMPLPAEKA